MCNSELVVSGDVFRTIHGLTRMRPFRDYLFTWSGIILQILEKELFLFLGAC